MLQFGWVVLASVLVVAAFAAYAVVHAIFPVVSLWNIGGALLIVWSVIWIVRPQTDSREILKARFANGELSAKQYKDMLAVL